ncbi:MAG TPA: penicillin acylase family protein, partial [Candidatus Hydrogenedentes bacterium]|nr:penicillin acylase family protein [Candidatus Hydrogenedentota bacterium]
MSGIINSTSLLLQRWFGNSVIMKSTFTSRYCAWALMIVMACPAYAQGMDVWRDATLYRDEWGTPHVYAENPFALAYVFGYAQAEDHAEHILLAYRMANGKLAAVLGEKYADSDAFSLKLGHARLAEQALAVADPVTLALCEGFATGINAWLVDNAQAVPSWADGVQPRDVLAYWHAFLMSMAPFELPDAFRRAPAMPTGNAWAMNAERSAEGNPVLVINPHQNHESFFQWYEAHLVTGDMNVYGATLRGLPVILQGHNPCLGWALTPNWPDFADMFIEEYESAPPNPRDPRVRTEDVTAEQAMLLYYMSQSLPYHIQTDYGLETRYVPAYIGDRGPVFEDATHGLNSWYIGGFTDFGGLRQLVEMARAPNIEMFWAALSMHQLPCFHVTYADCHNNIFYLYNTKAGLRLWPPKDGTNPDDPAINQQWDVPVSSDLSALAWHDVFALNELPAILNPASGYVQACGNTPWTVTEPCPLDPSLWPPWLFFDKDTYRAARVRQLLRKGQRSFRDHQSMLYDVVVPAALDMVPAILRAAETRQDRVSNAHPDFWAGIDTLRGWNYIAEINSPGMTFYHLWWNFARARAAQQFPTEASFYEAARADAPLAQDIMLRAVEDAARELRNEYGDMQVCWGDVHRIRRGVREAPLPGAHSGEPVFITGDYTMQRGRLIANYGYGFAMITQFGERPDSVSVLAFGVSRNNDSPHYDDQLDLLLERRFKRVRFDDDAVLRHADRAMGKSITLLPLGAPGAVTLHASNVIQGRLYTETEAPEPLPRDVIPFSLYMRPETRPAATAVTVELSV